MELRSRRWNDPRQPGDGTRLLVCRYRPRGIRVEDETWDAWLPNLGPSKDLHAAFYGKSGAAIPFEEYRTRYLEEMRLQEDRIRTLAVRLRNGEAITLLCSSACVDEARCHRALLKELILAHGARLAALDASSSRT